MIKSSLIAILLLIGFSKQLIASEDTTNLFKQLFHKFTPNQILTEEEFKEVRDEIKNKIQIKIFFAQFTSDIISPENIDFFRQKNIYTMGFNHLTNNLDRELLNKDIRHLENCKEMAVNHANYTEETEILFDLTPNEFNENAYFYLYPKDELNSKISEYPLVNLKTVLNVLREEIRNYEIDRNFF